MFARKDLRQQPHALGNSGLVEGERLSRIDTRRADQQHQIGLVPSQELRGRDARFHHADADGC
jgi:hypothetical protein